MSALHVAASSRPASARLSAPLPLAATGPRRAPLSRRLRPQASPARAAAEQAAEPEAVADPAATDAVPPGCARYTVKLRKPLGIVLEQDATGRVTVAEVVPDGNAAKSGEVGVGDELVGCSGVAKTSEQVYGEVTVRGGETLVRLNVRSERFEVVMAAIGSHSAGQAVTLDFQRCE